MIDATQPVVRVETVELPTIRDRQNYDPPTLHKTSQVGRSVNRSQIKGLGLRAPAAYQGDRALDIRDIEQLLLIACRRLETSL